ncbi:MAG: hypothetical protein J0J04_08085 [Microbacterium sp.]|uniref:hypothetical protein n=1 Tax=Microbacterium sp. TaxID=51671 RepID=UPI001AD3051A|nr:hypothetical protein [Microbacterium sp.]MBN9214759.1 hypothetical protein [Microbacterium sp.]
MVGVESVDVGGVPVSWYCASCSSELGADDAAPDGFMGQPAARCPHCGAEDLAWEPWAGEIADGVYYPHDENGLRTISTPRDGEPWG